MGGKFDNSRSRVKPPLVRLEHSHRRLEERLLELGQCVRAIAENREVDRNWDLVSEIVAYLQRAVARHEEDEEETVFPRLATHPALRPLLARLSGDHLSQGKQVAALRVLVDNHSVDDAVARLQRIARDLGESYLDHIAREERELLPAIERHVSPTEQKRMATEMARRRNRNVDTRR